jgi:hypothetical protein
MQITNKEVVMKFSVVLSVLLYSLSSFGTTMKVEGSCSGTLDDKTQVTLTYFSNFNGCSNTSSSAISLNSPSLGQGLYTGTRSIAGSQDIHSVKDGKKKEILALRFANSTGNTSAVFKYLDQNGVARVVTVQCNVRDYEYGECL